MLPHDTKDGEQGRIAGMVEGGGVSDSPSESPVRGARPLLMALIVALVAAVVASVLGDRLRIGEIVDLDDFYGGSDLSVPRATRNGAVFYGLLGAILSLGLGVTACFLSQRRSIARLLLAGITGIVVGAGGGVASSFGLFPAYFSRMETAELTLSVIVHLGIFVSLGAASGLAFGVGSGKRGVVLNSLVGGMTGAAVGSLLLDLSGAFLPLAHTERPLSEVAGTRLAASILVSLCIAAGAVSVASQKPRPKKAAAR